MSPACRTRPIVDPQPNSRCDRHPLRDAGSRSAGPILAAHAATPQIARVCGVSGPAARRWVGSRGIQAGPRLGDPHHHLELYGCPVRKLSNTGRGPSVPALFPEHRDQQVGRAVDHGGKLDEVGGGADEPQDLVDRCDPVEVADIGPNHREQQDNGVSCRFVRLLLGDIRSDLSLQIADSCGNEELVARPFRADVLATGGLGASSTIPNSRRRWMADTDVFIAHNARQRRPGCVRQRNVHRTFRINGEEQELSFAPYKTLLEVLREDALLTGTKHGCELGECGACAVLIDGRPVLSCLKLAIECDRSEILTVEGLARDAELHPLQSAFADLGGAQCGYCPPGILVTAKALLDRDPNPTRAAIKEALSGNLCRCTGYIQIFESVEEAIVRMRKGEASS